MRWRGRRQSSNIDDQRFSSSSSRLGGLGRGSGGGGLLRLLPLAIRFLGVKGTLAVAAVILGFSYFTGGDLGALLGQPDSAMAPAAQRSAAPPKDDAEAQQVEFVKVVLADTEDTWHALFEQKGSNYQEPRLVLFRNQVQSGCGIGQAEMGPFYCPADNKVYLDLSFFDELHSRHGAPGDFAQAYVIAHEVGHHVQTLLGTSAKVQREKAKLDQAQANQLSVKQELQADCYAGIWAHHANRSRQLLEQGDIEEGLAAASAIGDDRLQKQARGYVTPESFTHGSSAQRVAWFSKGYREGTLAACDTFAAQQL